jgi:hypothetical protein
MMYLLGVARPLSGELLVWVGGWTRASRCQSCGWDEAELAPVMGRNTDSARQTQLDRLAHGHTVMWCGLLTSVGYAISTK